MSSSDTPAPERRRPPPARAAFLDFSSVQTRWADNDRYGHINNSVYYFYFDTVINRYLITWGGLDIDADPVIAITAQSNARFVASFAYPDEIEAGLAVAHLSERSVRYTLGLFASGEDSARVYGEFVHVFCDRATMRPVAIVPRMRAALARLQVGPGV